MEQNELYGKFVGPFLRELGKRIPGLRKKTDGFLQKITEQIEHGKKTLEEVGEPIGEYLLK